MTPEDRLVTTNSVLRALELVSDQMEVGIKRVKEMQIIDADEQRQALAFLEAATSNVMICRIGTGFLLKQDMQALKRPAIGGRDVADIALTALTVIASGKAEDAWRWLAVEDGDLQARNLFVEIAGMALRKIGLEAPKEEEERPTLPDVPQKLCGITPADDFPDYPRMSDDEDPDPDDYKVASTKESK